MESLSLQDLGSIGEFVAAVAVVASLLYLAAQIRQNTRSVRAATSQSFVETSINFSALLIQDEKVARLYRMGTRDLSQLDEDQRVQFDALMISMWRSFQNGFYQRQDSLLEDDIWEGLRRNILWNFRQPGVSQWWESRRVLFSEAFCRFPETEGSRQPE